MFFGAANERGVVTGGGQPVPASSDEVGQGGFAGAASADDCHQAWVERDDWSLEKAGFRNLKLCNRLRRNGAGRGFRIDQCAAIRLDASLTERVKGGIAFYPAKAIEIGFCHSVRSMCIRAM